MYNRGRHWWDTHPATGKRTSTGCTDRKAADLVVQRWQRKAADPAHREAETRTLVDLYELAIEHKRRQGRSAATVTMYEEKLARIADAAEHIGRGLGERMPITIVATPAFIDAYIQHRTDAGLKPGTIHKELVCLRQALKLAARKSWAPANWRDAFPVGYSPQYQPRRVWLSIDLWDRFLDELPPPHRPRAAWALATGANASETAAARPEHVRRDESVHIPGTKTAYRDRNARTIPRHCAGRARSRRIQGVG